MSHQSHHVHAQKNIVLTGKRPGSVFVFLSGLGSGLSDLLPLATAICNEGHSCELIWLPFNVTGDAEWAGIDVSVIVDRIEATVEPYVTQGYAVYLIGFSFGATIAILYAADHACGGVVAISTFLRPTHFKLACLLFTFMRLTGRDYLKRRPQVTAPETIAQLDLSSRLPIDISKSAIAIGKVAAAKVADVQCPLLFVHSFDDQVSDYAAVVGALKLCGSDDGRLISFNHLNHYLQFDLSPSKLARFAIHYLGLPSPPQMNRLTPAEQIKAASDLLKLYTEERRHWSLLLFQTIAGFFTVFSVLLYNSLSDVVNNTERAPYYLISYSLAASIYLTITILYFFYANRVDAYVKFYIEPVLKGASWAAFRTSKWMAGKESYRATRLATIPLAIIPTILSIVSLVGCALFYPDLLFHSYLHFAVLKVLFLSAAGLSLYTVYALVSHSRFTRRWLYLAHPTDRSDMETEAHLFALYQSVSVGCVRQPNRR